MYILSSHNPINRIGLTEQETMVLTEKEIWLSYRSSRSPGLWKPLKTIMSYRPNLVGVRGVSMR